jgi:hypothetical protein
MFQVTKKMLAAMLVVAAIAAPAASARPIDPVQPSVTAHVKVSREVPSQISSTVPAVQTVESSSDGFNWGDAGIGAAAMFTLLGLGTGSLLVARRARERRPAATS